MKYYTLDADHKAIPADLMTWAASFENSSRIVAQEVIGTAEISTVFLGLDHRFGEGPPILFETMVFGGPLDQEQERCSTWEEAEAMHKAMCARMLELHTDGR